MKKLDLLITCNSLDYPNIAVLANVDMSKLSILQQRLQEVLKDEYLTNEVVVNSIPNTVSKLIFPQFDLGFVANVDGDTFIDTINISAIHIYR